RPIEPTVDILREPRSSGIPLYALTNCSAEKWEIAKQRGSFLGDFDGEVVAGKERVVKPDPRIYEILIERYALDPRHTLYTDDLSENIEQARRLGFQVELFKIGRASCRERWKIWVVARPCE